MSSTDQKHELQTPAPRWSDHKRQQSDAISLNKDGASERARTQKDKPVRISRKDAQKNIPPDSDPDAPASP